jgi:hypothetical protein
MSETFCSREQEVIQAVRSGQWRDELQSHIASCTTCGEAEHVARWMTGMAEQMSHAGIPPHPTVVWLKGQLEERRRRETALIRKAAWREVVVCAGILLAASLAALWLWPYVFSMTTEAVPWAALILPDAYSRVVAIAFPLGFILLLRRFRGRMVST